MRSITSYHHLNSLSSHSFTFFKSSELHRTFSNLSSTQSSIQIINDQDLQDDTIIRNPVGVQLLPRPIHRQVFPTNPFPPADLQAVKLSQQHLNRHGLATGLSPALPAPSIRLPPLQGSTIDQHFTYIGYDRSEPYLSIAKHFASHSLSPAPSNWAHQAGWTIYHPDGSFESIDHPPQDQQALVFDVETLPAHTQYAIMATAVTTSNWYSWLSPWLLGQSDEPNQLIPMPSNRPRLLVGHHVGFDRARLLEEHSIKPSTTRFLDTMSLHIATYGLSNPQRPAYVISQRSKKKNITPDLTDTQPSMGVLDPSPHLSDSLKSSRSHSPLSELSSHTTRPDQPSTWTDVASMNSLDEVVRLHCGIELDKSMRNAFMEWDRPQILAHLSQLLDYCSSDVSATHAVFRKLLPVFLEQCPHPVSFAGMLHMGNPFLPVDETWDRFLERAESTFQKKSSAVKTSLLKLAEATRKLMFARNPTSGRMIFEDDHWLKQLDWTPKKARWTEPGPSTAHQSDTAVRASGISPQPPESANRSPKAKSALPAWYDELRDNSDGGKLQLSHDSPLAAILFRVRYDSHPVLWSRKHGWMFSSIAKSTPRLPLRELNRDELPASLNLSAQECIYAIPSTGARSTNKVRTILSRNQSKTFSTGLLSSPYSEAATACQISKHAKDPEHPLVRAVYDKLAALANEAKELDSVTIATDPWLRQLDWTLVEDELEDAIRKRDIQAVKSTTPDTISLDPVSAQNTHQPPPTSNLLEEDKVWPHWYWLLTRGGINKIGLTTKSQITPLLLRLSFLGFPLYRSRQHGWTFRIPIDQLTEPYLSRTPLLFTFEIDPSFHDDQAEAVYFRVPHPGGDDENVGSPLGKSFDLAFETGVLQATPFHKDDVPAPHFFIKDGNQLKESDSNALTENAREALSMNMQCSYWLNASQRIRNQMVVWTNESGSAPVESSSIVLDRLDPHQRKQGVILPQVTVMGTVTRRATEKTWLAAANAKKNKIGTELKSMVRAPRGFAIVGADVDSEELWISSVMGDAQFGMHGATAIGWMTLEGTKASGTDLHSKTATILGISRNDAKVFNYSRIYGAGVTHAVQLLMKADPKASKDDATKLAKKLYASTKGTKNYRADLFRRKFWYGGTESYLFNKLEEIALAENPQTPALGCGVTRALRRCHLPDSGEGPDFMTSRVNWVVQSSGVDYLHMLIVAMDYLLDRYAINARYMISVHDEIRYLSVWKDRYRCALALQIANLWTRCQFAFKLDMDDLPQSCAWFSAVDVDHVLRKEVDLPCVTPSNPEPIPPGESLGITRLLTLIPDGLGHPNKPLEVTALMPDSVTLGINKVSHRTKDLEWLAAQAAKDKHEVKRHWDKAREPDWKRDHGEKHMFDSNVWEMIQAVEKTEPAHHSQPTRHRQPMQKYIRTTKTKSISKKVDFSSITTRDRNDTPELADDVGHQGSDESRVQDEIDMMAWRAFDAIQGKGNARSIDNQRKGTV